MKILEFINRRKLFIKEEIEFDNKILTLSEIYQIKSTLKSKIREKFTVSTSESILKNGSIGTLQIIISKTNKSGTRTKDIINFFLFGNDYIIITKSGRLIVYHYLSDGNHIAIRYERTIKYLMRDENI